MLGIIEIGFEDLFGKCANMPLCSQRGFEAVKPVGSPAWGLLEISYWVFFQSSLIKQ